MRCLTILAIPLLLAACGKPDNAPGPGGVTVGEAKALDEAAEMIEGQRVPQEAIAGGAAPVTTTPQPAPKK